MMQANAYGRLGGDPRQIETQNGTTMAVATLAVDVRGRDDGEDEYPLWLGVLAFGKQADALLRHAKGDLLSVAGRVQRRTFTGRDGAPREQLQVIAEAVVSARTVRPGGKRRQQGQDQERDEPRAEPHGEANNAAPEFDDPIPF